MNYYLKNYRFEIVLWALIVLTHGILMVLFPLLSVQMDSEGYLNYGFQSLIHPDATINYLRQALPQHFWYVLIQFFPSEVYVVLILHILCLLAQICLYAAGVLFFQANRWATRILLILIFLTFTLVEHAHVIMFDGILACLSCFLVWLVALLYRTGKIVLFLPIGFIIGISIGLKPGYILIEPVVLLLLWSPKVSKKWIHKGVSLLFILLPIIMIYIYNITQQYINNQYFAISNQFGKQFLGVAAPWVNLEQGIYLDYKSELKPYFEEYWEKYRTKGEDIDYVIYQPASVVKQFEKNHPELSWFDQEAILRKIAMESVLNHLDLFLLRVLKVTWYQIFDFVPFKDRFDEKDLMKEYYLTQIRIANFPSVALPFFSYHDRIQSYFEGNYVQPMRWLSGIRNGFWLFEDLLLNPLFAAILLSFFLWICFLKKDLRLVFLFLYLSSLGMILTVGLLSYSSYRYALPYIPFLMIMSVGLITVLQAKIPLLLSRIKKDNA